MNSVFIHLIQSLSNNWWKNKTNKIDHFINRSWKADELKSLETARVQWEDRTGEGSGGQQTKPSSNRETGKDIKKHHIHQASFFSKALTDAPLQ